MQPSRGKSPIACSKFPPDDSVAAQQQMVQTEIQKSRPAYPEVTSVATLIAACALLQQMLNKRW